MADLPADSARRRRAYLDWLRGLAVLIMIEAHLLDSWTRSPDRESREFVWAIILGGMGAPLFLFLAGVAVSMSAGSKARRTGDSHAASRQVMKRGLEIFGLAFLFRAQAWVLGQSSPRALLKVDILNIMGPAIGAAAAVWGAMTSPCRRCLAFALLTLAMAFATPSLRNSSFILTLPDPLEAYFRPVPGLTNFVFLPWMAFVFGGALVGALIHESRTGGEEARLNLILGIGGLGLSAAAFACSFLPSPFAPSFFWTTSPSFFLLRLGLLVAAVAGAYAWDARPGGSGKWSPLQQMGRSSLFIYWIHVEMIYGLVSEPLHRNLTLIGALIAVVLFASFMLVCSMLKDRAVDGWRRMRARQAATAA